MFAEGENHKLAVAKAHIDTAALMIAMDADPRSVHLLVMAAEELVRSYCKKTGKTLQLDIDGMMRAELRKEWFASKHKAYNYFKHADRDAEKPYSGPGRGNLITLNDMMILQAAINLPKLGVELASHVGWVWRAALVAHPQLVDWEAIPDVDVEIVRKAGANLDRATVREAILAQFLIEQQPVARLVDSAMAARARMPNLS